MTKEIFWQLVEKVHIASRGDMEVKCKLLNAELRQLPLAEVQSFEAHFIECLDEAYTWPLWAAAYIIGGGCSDDSFWDFRSTLVSMGLQTYERALVDPESLVDLDYDAETAHFEGYQYVAGKVEEDLSRGFRSPRSRPHPQEPTGEPWDEDKVATLYPRLAAKYAYRG